MKKFLIFAAFLFPILVLAQVVAPVDPSIPAVTHDEFLAFLLQSMGGLKGLSALGFAGLLVQSCLKFLGTDWAGKVLNGVSGTVKLGIVSLLAISGGILALMTTGGLTFAAAAVHATTLTTYMVFANQWFKKLREAPPTSPS